MRISGDFIRANIDFNSSTRKGERSLSFASFRRPKNDVASPKDLYYAMDEQVKKAGLQDNVVYTLSKFTSQPGYPVVHVSIKKNAMTLRQERFFLERRKRDVDLVDRTVWSIPITWASITNHSDYLNTTPRFWMTTKQETFYVSSSLVTLNVQQSGADSKRNENS